MANKDLEGKHYKCNHDIAKKHFGDTVSYTNLTTTKGRLENVDENDDSLTNLNPNEKKSLLDWINATLDNATSKIEHSKKVKANNGMQNAFRKRDTTKVQTTRSMWAESLDKEIESIKYLMEYMDNNNKNKLI